MISKLNIDFPILRVFSAFTPWVKSQRYPYMEDSTFYLNHARTGIKIAMSSLNLPAGSKVGVAMYNCVTVMNAVASAGLKVEFIDLTDDLKLDLDDLKSKAAGLSAIVVTHLFGIANDIDKIKSIVGDIPIIEDCAHAFGSRFEDGTAIGTKGDFAVFSIGLGKFPSIGEGGLLVVNNRKYLYKVDDECNRLKRVASASEVKMILMSHIKHLIYHPFIYTILKPVKDSLATRSQSASSYKHKESFMPRYVRYLYEKSLKDIDSTIKARQDNVKALIGIVSQIDGVYVPSFNIDCVNGFMLPVLVADYSKLRKCRALKRFELSPHFANSPIWASGFEYNGSCPNAEKIAKQIIVIPTYIKP